LKSFLIIQLLITGKSNTIEKSNNNTKRIRANGKRVTIIKRKVITRKREK
jgi:hypothetical protein